MDNYQTEVSPEDYCCWFQEEGKSIGTPETIALRQATSASEEALSYIEYASRRSWTRMRLPR